MRALTPVLLSLSLLAASARGQAEEPAPAEVERVYVPRKGFEKVLRRHPRGALITAAELERLLKLAGARPAKAPAAPPAPLAATIQRLTVSGKVEQGVATLTADAAVSVLAPGQVGLPLPLQKIGLQGVWVDGKPARVIVRAGGPQVLLAPSARRVTWSFALSVEPGEGRGSGVLRFPVPACASGRLRLDLPGDLELRTTATTAAQPDAAVLWAGTRAQGRTLAEGAFGGAAATQGQVVGLRWRPRQALERLAPYVTASTEALFHVQPGVADFDAWVRLQVYRAALDRFTLRLPPGFVVTRVTFDQGAATHLQRGDRVEVRLDTPRRGKLALELSGELSLAGGKRAGAQRIQLAPIGVPGADRVHGELGIARAERTALAFGAARNLRRVNLSAFFAKFDGILLREYATVRPDAVVEVTVSPLAPKVDLRLNTTVQVREREVRAVALYRYRVEQGAVFNLQATLPAGYRLERTLLLRGGRRLAHSPKRRVRDGRTELTLDLERALRKGQELVFAVEAVAEHPAGLAGQTLALPHFAGAPATRFSGHLGLAPVGTFALRGTGLKGLTAIPARELRTRGGRGIEWADIVLGYRLEAPAYGGQLVVRTKQRRVAVEALAYHEVREQAVHTDLVLDLDVSGAPLDELVLLYPPGVGALATVEGPGAVPDRTPLGTNADGWERFRIGFARPQSGAVRLRVRFATKLEAGAQVTQRLPRVSVEGAVRQRGALAVFSSGATELSETVEGLRPLDVTEVPRHPFRRGRGERPLLAYTHVKADHALTLKVTRHTQAPVLTAVAERLRLETSVGPDGTARHTATFRVKNLANQYFALQLPEDAVLWSVVVDGEGVKPAGEGGERIIPIPTAGTKGPNQVTEVVATYTSPGSAWGRFGASSLIAPELKFGKTDATVTDVVPVLQTTWALSLPDDYRVLEFAGNVDGQPVPHVGALAIAAWGGFQRGPWPWLLGLGVLALGVAASSRIRDALLVALFGAREAARNAKDGLGDAAASPGVRKGALALVVLLLVVGGVYTFRGSFVGDATPLAPMLGVDLAQSERAPAQGGAEAKRKKRHRGPAGDKARAKSPRKIPPRAPMPGAVAPPSPPASNAGPSDAPARPRDKLFLEGKKPSRQNRGRWGKGKSGAKAGRLAADPNAAPKTQPAPEKSEEDAKKLDDAPDMDGAPAEPEPETKPSARPAKPKPVLKRKEADRRIYGEGDELNDEEAPASGEMGDDFGAVAEDALAKDAVQEVEREKVALGPGGWGQVGLRSLVLRLTSVGRTASFQRAGGGATLEVGFVREALLIGAGGLLALLGFVAGLLLPRLGRLNAAGILTVTLVAASAVPILWPGSALTALLNALVLGLALSGAGLALLAAARWWGTAPLSRLSAALDALGEERAVG